MNIFILDKDPVVAASYLCDKHVPKMLVESVQLLCNGLNIETPYTKTHPYHPCTYWVKESFANWLWLYIHAVHIYTQHRKRFGTPHKSVEPLKWCHDNERYHINFDKKELTPFALAMPDVYKCDDVVKSYRAYYKGDKARFAKWKLGEPTWWN